MRRAKGKARRVRLTARAQAEAASLWPMARAYAIGWARRRNAMHASDDLIGAAAVGLCQALARYQPGWAANEWEWAKLRIVGELHNTLYGVRGRHLRHRAQSLDQLIADGSGPDLAAPHDPPIIEQRETIDAMLACYTPRERQIAILVDIDGHTPTEAAAMLGIGRPLVSKHLYNARTKARAAAGE